MARSATQARGKTLRIEFLYIKFHPLTPGRDLLFYTHSAGVFLADIGHKNISS